MASRSLLWLIRKKRIAVGQNIDKKGWEKGGWQLKYDMDET